MTEPFDPEKYGPVLAEAIGREPPMPLDAGAPDRAQHAILQSLSIGQAFAGHSVAHEGSAACVLAGVWLLHGYLDEAHTIVQHVPSASGSYWHGVMHRREGDYGNASYWFGRAGDHPAGAVIAAAAAERPETVELALGGRWDPFGFNDRVRGAAGSHDPGESALVALQRAEWRALFDFCWRRAIGD